MFSGCHLVKGQSRTSAARSLLHRLPQLTYLHSMGESGKALRIFMVSGTVDLPAIECKAGGTCMQTLMGEQVSVRVC